MFIHACGDLEGALLRFVAGSMVGLMCSSRFSDMIDTVSGYFCKACAFSMPGQRFAYIVVQVAALLSSLACIPSQLAVLNSLRFIAFMFQRDRIHKRECSP